MRGWATAGKGTTGGAGGDTVTVSSPADLIHHISRSGPVVIQVKGMIDLGQSFPGYKSNGRYYVESNKTIIGLGSDAGIRNGELRLAEVSNVIIRNLTFRKAPDTAIAITHGSTNVWIDHNDFADAADGLVDITRGSDLVTVSWNRFSNHDKTTLVGASNSATGDRNRLRVTYHHNWFVGTNQRHPRVRYGKVHVFNNYYDSINAGIAIGVEAEIFSENNFFHNSNTPVHYQDTSSQPGYMRDSGTVFGKSIPSLRSSGVSWRPSSHYNYSLIGANDVPTIVRAYAGVGKIDGSANPKEPEPEPEPVEPRDPVGVIAYYPLTEGSGNIARDESGFGDALNLNLSGGATWLSGGGVSFPGSEAKLMSTGSSAKLVEQIAGTGQFSLEVWARPGHLNQPDSGSHPSRIVTLSKDGSNRNFMLGHGGQGYQAPELAVRLRTQSSEDDDNGMPNIVAAGEIASELSHYVVTFDGSTVRIFRDGEIKHSEKREGALTNWDPDFTLVFGNETSGNRGWVGELHQVAFFDVALTGAEVLERYSTGQTGKNPKTTTYAEWLLATYPDMNPEDLVSIDPSADPYGTGTPNLIRYALVESAMGSEAGSTHTVTVQPNPTSGLNYLTMKYNHRASATDTKILVEVSSDLKDWTLLGEAAILKVVPNGEANTVTIRDSVPIGESNERFMRLRVNLQDVN